MTPFVRQYVVYSAPMNCLAMSRVNVLGHFILQNIRSKRLTGSEAVIFVTFTSSGNSLLQPANIRPMATAEEIYGFVDPWSEWQLFPHLGLRLAGCCD